MKETQHTRTELISTSRRNVLRGAGAVGAFSVFGVPAFSGTVLADDHQAFVDFACELDIVCAIDTSGSLNGTEIGKLEDGVNRFIGLLPTDGTVTVGTLEFGNGGVRNKNDLQVPGGLTVSLPSNGAGNTPMPGAMDIADQAVYNDPAARSDATKLVVLFTDGGPNYRNTAYTLGGYTAPRDDSADWSATAGDSTYDNESAAPSTVSEGEMDETKLVADSIKAGSTGGGATLIATVYVGDANSTTEAMSSNAEAAYTDLPTYLEENIATDNLGISGDFTEIDSLVDELAVLIGENCKTCVDCKDADVDGVKYEFACTETDPVTGECTAWDFDLEGDGVAGIRYTPESFTSKDGEAFEPMTVSFETDYCELSVLVKSGQEFEVQSFEDIDGGVTVETANGEKYAISFVQFFCTEQAAIDAGNAFPSKGKGKGA